MNDDHATCAYSGLRSLASLLQEQEEREAQRAQAKMTLSAEDKDRIIQMAWEDRTQDVTCGAAGGDGVAVQE